MGCRDIERGDFIAKKKYKGKFTQREIELLAFILYHVYTESQDDLIRGFCKRVLERFEYYPQNWDIEINKQRSNEC